jgi:hypothetical protein
MIEEHEYFCIYPYCNKRGHFTFRGRPHRKYCKEHYEELAPRIRNLNAEHQRWIERRNEEEDNTPARQPRPW